MTTLRGLSKEIMHYSDVTANVSSTEMAVSRLQIYLDDDSQNLVHHQRMSMVKFLIENMVNIGQINFRDPRYRPIDEFFYRNYGTFAPSFVTNDIAYTGKKLRDEELGVLAKHMDSDLVIKVSTLFAPVRTNPNPALDDSLGLCFDRLAVGDMPAAQQYASQAYNAYNSPWRHEVKIDIPKFQGLIIISADGINKARERHHFPIIGFRTRS